MDERNDGEKTRVISAKASSFSDIISHELEQKRAVGFNGPFFVVQTTVYTSKPLFY